MKNIRFESKTIKEIIENQKIYNMDLPYQRNDDAWTKKNQESLIDSIENYFLIPPIILNEKNKYNYDVLDGKQRLTAIFKLKEKISSNGLFYKFPIMVLENESEEKIEETFIRINKNSIRLNKNEFLIALANSNNREFFIELAKDHNYQNLIKNNKKPKRLSYEEIVIWIFTIINIYNTSSKSSIRKSAEKIVKQEFDVYYLNEQRKNFIKTFKFINDVLDKNIFESKNFKTFFTSIFVAFYFHIDESTYLLSCKDYVNEKIKSISEEIKNEQKGGGTKYDGIIYARKRINKIENILIELIEKKDTKRVFSKENKDKKLIEQNYKCELCGVSINNETSHADHIIPFSKGGQSNIENLQVLCKHCNLTKSNK